MLIGPTSPSLRPSWGPKEALQQGYRDPRKVTPTTRAALKGEGGGGGRGLAIKGSREKSCERDLYQRRTKKLMHAGKPRTAKKESEFVNVGRRTTKRFR
jgi:hypothetical protein